MLRCRAMGRVRLLLTCAMAATWLGLALEGCSSFDGPPPDVGTDAATEAAAAPESGGFDAGIPDATPSHPPLTPIYARGYGSTGDAGGPVTIVPTGMLVDPSGGIILAGSYAGGSVEVGGTALATPLGGDAFLVQLDGSGGHLFSKVFGDAALQMGGEVVGSTSKLYASFFFGGTILFDSVSGAKVVSQGGGTNANSAVAQFGPQLEFSAAFALSGPGPVRVTHLALGASGSVISFGDWNNAIQTGTATTVTRDPSHPGLVVARILSDSAPDVVHTDYCPDATSCSGSAIATNIAGEALVGGRFIGTISGFDGGTGVTATADEDAYLMKLDSLLSPQWLVSFGGSGAQEVTAIAPVPKTSDFVVAGVFHGEFAMPGGMPIPATDAGSDLFVARVDGTGKVMWSKTFGGGGDDVVRGLAVDGDANVFLVGDFHGPNLSFGGSVLINADSQGRGTRDVFLAWLNGDGEHVYSAAFGSPGDESPIGVGIDGTGNILIAGSFDEGIDFGAGRVKAVGATDMFVARLAR
jgi:hypothetical protein